MASTRLVVQRVAGVVARQAQRQYAACTRSFVTSLHCASQQHVGAQHDDNGASPSPAAAGTANAGSGRAGGGGGNTFKKDAAGGTIGDFFTSLAADETTWEPRFADLKAVHGALCACVYTATGAATCCDRAGLLCSQLTRVTRICPAACSATPLQRIQPDDTVLRRAWKEVNEALEAKIEAARGKDVEEVVPVVEYSDVAELEELPPHVADRVRDTGVLVLRQVVEEEQALQWKAEVRQYIADNPGVIGFPEDNPQVLYQARRCSKHTRKLALYNCNVD